MNVRITAPKLPTLLKHLGDLITMIPRVAEDSGKALADEILLASQTVPPMVPVKTGALQSTGRVEQQRSPGGQFTSGFKVLYGGLAPGGTDVYYAEYRHDDLRPNIKYTKPGSGPKFLETHANRLWEQHLINVQRALASTIRLTVG